MNLFFHIMKGSSSKLITMELAWKIAGISQTIFWLMASNSFFELFIMFSRSFIDSSSIFSKLCQDYNILIRSAVNKYSMFSMSFKEVWIGYLGLSFAYLIEFNAFSDKFSWCSMNLFVFVFFLLQWTFCLWAVAIPLPACTLKTKIVFYFWQFVHACERY